MRSRILGLFSFVLFFSLSASEAQLTTGTITGTVTDQSGAAVPGAAITVREIETGIVRTTVTSSGGRYEAATLPVGNYEVSGSLEGFRTSIRKGIELTVGRHAVVDLVLEVGEVTQNVTVTGEASLVETTTATVSNLVDEKRVAELPLNNRDLNELAFLQPGVLRSREKSSGSDGFGTKLVVAGARANQNLYLLDGVPNANYMGSAAGASDAYTGAETVKEFQIITNNYSAEHKSTAGAIISAVTKSGTNWFHGSAFEFLRNDNFDAANFFDNAFGIPKPEFGRNQFGGSLGGPLLRNRTFFFGSYEGTRERLYSTATQRVPTLAAREGILPAGTVLVNPVMKPYLALYPVPGQGNAVVQDFRDGTILVAGTGGQPVKDDFAAGRADHQFSSGKAGFLSGTYNYDQSSRSPFGLSSRKIGGPSQFLGLASERHTVSVRHTSVLSPAALNEFSFGYSFSNTQENLAITDSDFSAIAFIPGRKLIGQVRVGSLDDIGFNHNGDSTIAKVFTFKDGLSLTRGNHSLRLGIEMNTFRYRIDSSASDGDWIFSNVTDFLTGTPQQFSASLSDGNDVSQVKQLYFGSYFQDNYQVSNSLTLNLGLRHEFVTVAEEVTGKSAALIHFMDPARIVGKIMTNPTLKSFSPRFGFAWAPASRRTSVRGGAAIFYDLPMLANVRGSFSGPPFRGSGTVTSANARQAGTTLQFPNAYLTQRALLQGSPDLTTIQYDAKNTYAYRWSITLQRELGGGWLVAADYTGARALHLWTVEDMNLNRWEGWPNQPSGPKFWPVITGTNRINPAWGSIKYRMPQTNSYYQGLGLGVQKRLSRGAQLQVAYTFSKTIDQGTSLSGGGFGEQQNTIYGWDMNLKRALSAQDVRKSLNSNFSYELPLGRNLNGLGAALVKGWQLNGILTLTDGSPASILDKNNTAQKNRNGGSTFTANQIPGGDNNPTSGTTAGCAGVPAGTKLGGPTLYYDPCQFAPVTPGYFGTLARNTVILPGIATVDFSLIKRFSVTENNRLEFRAEFFNLFNHTNFGFPLMVPFTSQGRVDGAAGQIVATRTPARQIQFGLKYTF